MFIQLFLYPVSLYLKMLNATSMAIYRHTIICTENMAKIKKQFYYPLKIAHNLVCDIVAITLYWLSQSLLSDNFCY